MFKPEDALNPQEIIPTENEATIELSSEKIISTPEQFEFFKTENEQSVQNETNGFVEKGEQSLSSGLTSLGLPNFSSALEAGKQLLAPIKKKALGLALSFGSKLAGVGVVGSAVGALGGLMNESSNAAENIPNIDPIISAVEQPVLQRQLDPETTSMFSDATESPFESSGKTIAQPAETTMEKSSLFAGAAQSKPPVNIGEINKYNQAVRDSASLDSLSNVVIDKFKVSRKPGYVFEKTAFDPRMAEDPSVLGDFPEELKSTVRQQQEISKRSGIQPVGVEQYTDKKAIDELSATPSWNSVKSFFGGDPVKETTKDVFEFSVDKYKAPVSKQIPIPQVNAPASAPTPKPKQERQKIAPLHVTDPKDPNLKAFRDSTDAFMSGERIKHARSDKPSTMEKIPFSKIDIDNKQIYPRNEVNPVTVQYEKWHKKGIDPVKGATIKNDPEHRARYLEYKKPVREVILDKPEAVVEQQLPLTEKVVTVPEVGVPETYTMFDGKKYSYDELLQTYPALKDPRVFEMNFHKKPPTSSK